MGPSQTVATPPPSLAVETWDEFVSLSAFDDLLKLIAASQGNLVALQVAAAVEAGGPFSAATKKIALDLQRIIANNPDKSIADILIRDDIQLQLLKISQRSAAQVQATVLGAHEQAYLRGRRITRATAKNLGLTLPPQTAYEKSAFLLKLEEGLADKARFHPAAIQVGAIKGFGVAGGLDKTVANPAVDLASRRGSAAKQGVDKTADKAAQSSRASATVAASRGFNEAALAEMKAIRDANPGEIIAKIWTSTLSLNTCPTCAALHGTVVALDDEFGHDQTFGGTPLSVYGDLTMPPRHPSCHCVLTIYVESPEAIAMVAKMKKDAQTHALAMSKQAPRAWRQGKISQTAKNSDFMESADIRGASDSQFEEALSGFRQCMLLKGFGGPKPKPGPTLSAGQLKDLKGSSLEPFLEDDGNGGKRVNAERNALHQRIIAKELAGATKSDDPTITFLGGGAASGKSTVFKPPKGAVTIDPDGLKHGIPGFLPKKPGFVHEESSYIAKLLTAQALEAQYDVVVDAVGSNVGSVASKVNQARASGYKVNGTYVSTDLPDALSRNLKRARTVPFDLLSHQHSEVAKNFPELLSLFDSGTLTENRTGHPLVQVAHREGGQLVIDNAQAWSRFLRKIL